MPVDARDGPMVPIFHRFDNGSMDDLCPPGGYGLAEGLINTACDLADVGYDLLIPLNPH